jgi:hypothetical protein
MIRDKSSSEIQEMFNISYLPDQNVNEPTVNDNTSELAEAAASDDIAATSEADTMNK